MRVRSGRPCLRAVEATGVAAVPGLSQVMSALDLLRRLRLDAVSVSISSTDTDAALLTLSQEATGEAGLRVDISRSSTMLVLRFLREGGA